jgi:hypothetical protein
MDGNRLLHGGIAHFTRSVCLDKISQHAKSYVFVDFCLLFRGTASEPDKNESYSQKLSRSSPRDPSGILKRPPTPESDTGPPTKKDSSSRGGPEKRIVKGALASIIGGGLGRPPRGSRDGDVKKGPDSDAQGRGGAAGSRGGGRQSRREQRSLPERGPVPVEPSGLGDIADELGESSEVSGGQSADWGTPNPLVASAGNEQTAGGVRKDGASRRGGARTRPSGGGPIEGDSQATGWDEASEGLLKAPAVGVKGESPQNRAGSSQEAASSVDGGKLGSATPQMTILQRNRGRRGSSPTGSNRSTDREGRSGPVHGAEASSVGSIATKLDGLQVGDVADGTRYNSARSHGRGQQVAGNQSPRQGEEGLARGWGRGSRRRGQAQGHAQTHESKIRASPTKETASRYKAYSTRGSVLGTEGIKGSFTFKALFRSPVPRACGLERFSASFILEYKGRNTDWPLSPLHQFTIPYGPISS